MPCTKRKYPGESAARKANQRASYRIHTYYCDECRAWHASNAEKEGHRARHGNARRERWKD